MTRVRYLAGFVGAPERRPAPLLRPPRRLFPHEPPPAEPLPSPQAAGEAGGDPPPFERVVGLEPVAPRSVRPEPAGAEPEAVLPARARRLDTPSAPVASSAEDATAPPPQGAVRVARAPAPAAVRPATPAADPAPLARREVRAAEPDSASRGSEPPRLRPAAASPPEPGPVAKPRSATAPRTPVLHIGSIDVTVTPAPAALREPAFAAPTALAPQPSAPFRSRGASVSRWFGLAQR